MRKRIALAFSLLVILNLNAVHAQVITGDSIFESLSSEAGNPVRGRAIVASRQTGLCLLCHSGPFPEERFQGNLAPELKASVARLNAPQLRARIVNAAHFNPATIMPAYYQTSHLNRVASKFVGQTILSGQEIEDVVAFLMTLNNQN
ncbi:MULTISPECIES: sulfur oxidation c-type cytochrome SoxX [unclassified Polynucleobacter]|uniref:sulfur oxidation c-type cytochrome SoxX n=1 Tax=unclassified Polynucleobacter TaxID=2640945 RepID=UPI001C0D235A|nr:MULTISPECIES: sulfur oxidation c-type cytochrome SoxX [unclassified Polynucleobacter]MBU3603484.1 sulfur oxidation c-type cytochrome SoxX [Polynucleobacter sp. AP-Kaivos-20-H2]MBU3617704.1 sulfur oxidation c-type cytochrome SoxX [Polynucleobacter sp. JS-Fieb-80-E5]